MSNNSQLIKNLVFIGKQLGLNKEQVATISVSGIGKSTFERYAAEISSPNINTQKAIADAINKSIRKNPVLSARFPDGLLPNDLMTEDLEALSKKQGFNIVTIFSDKFIGTYMCYYTSTNVEGEKTTHCGVLQLCSGESPNEFIACGTFSIKSADEAQELFDKLKDGRSITDELNQDNPKLFTGMAYLSSTLLWCNMSNKEKNDHVSFSFDLSEKITTKHPEGTFCGSRGIALSQTSGHSNQTATFPIVIVKKPLTVSPNELTKYLHFNYSQIAPEELDKLANKTVAFFLSQKNNSLLQEASSETLITNILSAFIKHELKDLLGRHVYNSHYFLSEENAEFYQNIIRPMRRGTPSD